MDIQNEFFNQIDIHLVQIMLSCCPFRLNHHTSKFIRFQIVTYTSIQLHVSNRHFVSIHTLSMSKNEWKINVDRTQTNQMKVLYSCLRKFVFAELVRSMCCCIIISNWMGFIMFISLLCYFLLYVFCSVRMYVSYHLIERFLLLNNHTTVLQLHFCVCVHFTFGSHEIDSIIIGLKMYISKFVCCTTRVFRIKSGAMWACSLCVRFTTKWCYWERIFFVHNRLITDQSLDTQYVA